MGRDFRRVKTQPWFLSDDVRPGDGGRTRCFAPRRCYRHDFVRPRSRAAADRPVPVAGLVDCLDFLEGFAFVEDDLDYLGQETGLDRAALAALRERRFTGDVRAVPEGCVVFAGEPLLEVTAQIAQAQPVETALLNFMTFQTAVASKSARCRVAAGTADLVDFAARRTHGLEAAMAVARASAVVGFDGTSYMAAARRHGLSATGTMAHSYVEAFPDERSAFRAFAEAPIDVFGVGTSVGVSADAPSLDSAYKLVEYDGRPVMKLSAGKVTAPGRKQAFRGGPHDGDVLALHDEPVPPGRVPLLVPVMVGGVRVGPRRTEHQTVLDARSRFHADLEWLPPTACQLTRPEPVAVHPSERLVALTDQVRRSLRDLVPRSS